MAYLPKLKPTVGGGLGGLPARKSSRVSRNEPFSPLHIVNRGETASISAGNTGNHTFGFTINDPAKCLIRIQSYTNYSAHNCDSMCPIEYEQLLVQQLYQSTARRLALKLINSTTIDIVYNNNDYSTYIEVVEYDFDYDSIDSVALPTATSDGVTQALAVPIPDPLNTLFFLQSTTTGNAADSSQGRRRVGSYSTTLRQVQFPTSNGGLGAAVRLEDKDTLRVWNWGADPKTLYVMHLGKDK